MAVGSNELEFSKEHMHEFFVGKYGEPASTGWSPRMRYRFGYHLPGDIYEALLDRLLEEGMAWLDVGGGDAVLPHHPELAATLTNRAGWLTCVDPSPNVHRNSYADEKVQAMLEDYTTQRRFDLVTFRMVAEHVEHPDLLLASLAEMVDAGGKVVVYTVNKYSPVPLIARVTPHRLHSRLIRMVVGNVQERNVFPVHYRMNTRATLAAQFERHGFREQAFAKLDDLSTTINVYWLHRLDNGLRAVFRRIGLRYPEYNLLGVYERNA